MTGSTWKLPGYLVQERLGVGGSAQVWQARRRSDGTAVAVKLLPAVERSQLAAVRAEAAMLSGLDHPHLLHLREVVPVKDGLALVVDLAAGGSLASLLRSRGRLTQGEVVTAIAPIGAALAYAHNAAVVHGDVTPANLLFTDVGLPLLADLGVARLAGDESAVRSTPAYVDPAVAGGGVPAAASDVFMLGAVALHALTGDPPWRGGTAAEVLAAAAAGDIGDVPARLSAAGVPGPLADVVSRALQFEPERRPTAAEFALDLRYAAQPVAVELSAGRRAADTGAVGPADDSALFTHAVRPAPRHCAPPAPPGRPVRWWPVATGCALLALLAATLLVWPHGPTDHRPQGQPPPPASERPPASDRPPAPPSRSLARRTPAASSVTPGTSSVTPGTSRVTAAVAAGLLAALDATRARAFAQRDASLLALVYSAGPLRGRDTATLTSIVPVGCGLVGVRTDYAR
ncbi:MAG: protein kinase, partial [Jatrophihabitantaceae bacterium]